MLCGGGQQRDMGKTALNLEPHTLGYHLLLFYFWLYDWTQVAPFLILSFPRCKIKMELSKLAELSFDVLASYSLHPVDLQEGSTLYPISSHTKRERDQWKQTSQGQSVMISLNLVESRTSRIALVRSKQHKVYKTKWSHSCQPRGLPVRPDTLV